MKNSLPLLDPQDASEGVRTFSEGVSLFANQAPVFLFKCHGLGKSVHYVFPRIKLAYLVFFSLYYTHVHVLSFHSLYL